MLPEPSSSAPGERPLDGFCELMLSWCAPMMTSGRPGSVPAKWAISERWSKLACTNCSTVMSVRLLATSLTTS